MKFSYILFGIFALISFLSAIAYFSSDEISRINEDDFDDMEDNYD